MIAIILDVCACVCVKICCYGSIFFADRFIAFLGCPKNLVFW